MYTLLKFLLREVFALVLGQVEEACQCGGVEQMVATLPEDQAQLGVIVGHQRGTRVLLGHADQTMDVLHSLECFLQRIAKHTAPTLLCVSYPSANEFLAILFFLLLA